LSKFWNSKKFITFLQVLQVKNHWYSEEYFFWTFNLSWFLSVYLGMEKSNYPESWSDANNKILQETKKNAEETKKFDNEKNWIADILCDRELFKMMYCESYFVESFAAKSLCFMRKMPWFIISWLFYLFYWYMYFVNKEKYISGSCGKDLS